MRQLLVLFLYVIGNTAVFLMSHKTGAMHCALYVTLCCHIVGYSTVSILFNWPVSPRS